MRLARCKAIDQSGGNLLRRPEVSERDRAFALKNYSLDLGSSSWYQQQTQLLKKYGEFQANKDSVEAQENPLDRKLGQLHIQTYYTRQF